MLKRIESQAAFSNPGKPELFREQYPYSEVPKILFDEKTVPMAPPEKIWITDTTFRDGQQARPPYKPEQILHLFDLLHRLGGPKGIIRQSEFFLYSDRDREAVEACIDRKYTYPEVTGWIRANEDDFKLVKNFGLKETGILTSVSDYHIYLKLKSDRKKVLDSYIRIINKSLEEGIIPRCHFEDITKADIYGFCLPFAEELMKLSQESGLPIKIRLCDTMGTGISYPGAVLPRSVPKLIHAFNKELGYPSELLEWHGHNDFHKVHINGGTAWLYGCSALNSSLLGYGERAGNPPLEGAVMEYIGLKGGTDGMDTRVITEIAEYFRNEIKAKITSNYPFVGIDFNTTRAGIHADGLLKNEEIYNIFDTKTILNRPIRVMVTDKSGMAGIAHWLNENITEIVKGQTEAISKRHPGVKYIYEWVMVQYDHGRTTSISSEELLSRARHYIPSLFESHFKSAKKEALALAHRFAAQFSQSPEISSGDSEKLENYLKKTINREPFIHLMAVTNMEGHRIVPLQTQRGEKGKFRRLSKKDFNSKEWFKNVLTKGEIYQSDLFFSEYTGELIMTTALPLKDKNGSLYGVLDVDFKFEEVVKLLDNLPVKEI
ncbi:MAG: histone-lysine N-methyltransferase [Spirochaetaceae bacterium]|nr:histone-lysine N-methyltransferase [Spirochaetaceae bacterium]